MAITRRSFLGRAAAAAVAAAGVGGCATAAADRTAARPNIIVFFTDDHGYADLGCMGAADLKTPHLDRVAREGVRFTSWYSNSPVCSPSRAALLSGRYPAHAGVRNILGGHRDTPGLPASTPTLAEVLRPLGYRTGLFGKWHLGAAEPFRPHHRGFDESFGLLSGCVDCYSHIFYWGGMGNSRLDAVHDLWENGREVWEDGRYITELIAERAVEFVRRNAPQGPFFLYVPFNAPHYPLHAPEEYLDRFPASMPWERRIMAAMLAAVDDGAGRVLDEVRRQGVEDNTIVVFSSDNGPSRETRNWMDGRREAFTGGSAGPLREGKFSLFEGGIRVPGLMRWPGRLPAGTVEDRPAAAMDLFPTLLRAAGGDPAAYEPDGCDLTPALTGTAPWPERRLFWEYGPQTAVREGDWKLVLKGRASFGDAVEEGPFLANLAHDPGEQRNLANDEPDRTARLTRLAEDWRAKITAG